MTLPAIPDPSSIDVTSDPATAICALVEPATAWLAQATDVAQVHDAKAKASALETYAKARGLTDEAIHSSIVIQLRAGVALGRLLPAPPHGPGRGNKTLSEDNLFRKDERSRFRSLAEHEDIVEKAIVDTPTNKLSVRAVLTRIANFRKLRRVVDVEPGDVVMDDEGEERVITRIEADGDEILLFDQNDGVLIVGNEKDLPITKPDLGDGLSHPARFSSALLPIFGATLPVDEFPVVLDPFAGTGRIHELPNRTIGVEIEHEWAGLHTDTLHGSALSLPFRDESVDAIVTSPTYGNRLADSYNSADPELRRSYHFDLGHELHHENSGAMRWGHIYRYFHTEAWVEAIRVLRPGGRFVLNIKDHIRDGRRQHVAGWHVTSLILNGMKLMWCTDVATGNLRQGENAELRFDEQVFVFEKLEMMP